MSKKIILEIPGKEPLSLEHLFLDFNGTLAFDGVLIDGVRERLLALGEKISITVLTADTSGTAKEELSTLPLVIHKIATGEDKRTYTLSKSKEGVAAIGNGFNDVGMCRASQLGIAIIGPEGACAQLLENTDIVVRDIRDGLDLLLAPNRLKATLRL